MRDFENGHKGCDIETKKKSVTTAPPPAASLLDMAMDEQKRASLRDRAYSAQFRAERESRKASQMAELGALLDKNPDVARILDLMEEVGR